MGSLLVRLAIGCLLAMALAPAAAVEAQSPPPVQAPLDVLVTPFFRQLAALKGLSASGGPPPIVARSRQESRRFMEQEMARRYSPARIEAERKGMVAWGLIPPDYDLRRLFLDLLQEQIAAYYDPRAKVMVVGDWLPVELQVAALVHEMVHALQDRDVSIDQFMDPVPGKGDQLLARQALLEGEAVALTLDVVLRLQGRELASLPDLNAVRSIIAVGADGPEIRKAPKFLRTLMLFPYSEGLNFVFEFRKRHPWTAVSTLYRDPPRSSAQIIHPDQRLVARQDPIQIALPELSPLLGGLGVVAEDELGEFALAAVIGDAVGEAEGRQAAQGWRGDRYRIWEDPSGRLVLVYVVAFETDRQASDGARALRASVLRRHRLGSGAASTNGGLTVWTDGPRSFFVEQRGPELLLMEQVPTASGEALREAVWGSRRDAPRP